MKLVRRTWGSYFEIIRLPFLCLKVLSFHPEKRLSVQRHFQRSELWIGLNTLLWKYYPKGEWHTYLNTTVKNHYVFEIQWGEKVVEEDIERKFEYE
jgi:hypothetical protein